MKKHFDSNHQMKNILNARQKRVWSGPRLLVGLSFLMIGLSTATLVFSVSLLGDGLAAAQLPAETTTLITQTTTTPDIVTIVSDKPADKMAQISIGDEENWVYRQDKFTLLVMRGDAEQICEVPAETPEVTPSPTPYPELFDANGIPQEGMPVENFIADNTLYYVASGKANLRELPNTSAPVTASLTRGDTVTRVGYGLSWSKVESASGKSGYVLTSLITTDYIAKPTAAPTATPKPTAAPTAAPKPTAAPTATPKPTAAPTAPPEPTASPTTAPEPTVTPSPIGASLTDEQKQAIIDLARAQIGVRYVYAKMDPAIGFDCSGLTSYIYKTLFNIKLPRSARDQAGFGLAVAVADIQVGDIICFDYSEPYGLCDHVGIYIGNGRYIHASSSDRTYYTDSGAVKEAAIDFTKKPVISIRRIIS